MYENNEKQAKKTLNSYVQLKKTLLYYVMGLEIGIAFRNGRQVLPLNYCKYSFTVEETVCVDQINFKFAMCCFIYYNY